MTFNPESKEISNLDSNDVLKVFEFFKYDSVFKYSTLLKMATIVSISLFVFYMNIEDSFVLLVGFFIGRIFVIKSSFIDLITGQVDYYNKFKNNIIKNLANHSFKHSLIVNYKDPRIIQNSVRPNLKNLSGGLN